jgi:16S rRNA (guanine966-N2)-methyltransferase
MRIVGGKWGGRRLAILPNKLQKNGLRPTMDRVRETLFNILQHGDFSALKRARVLDLFSGTGALGLEALSRGAEHASFVDIEEKSLDFVRENTMLLQAHKGVTLLKRDATNLNKNTGRPFNLIFLDPPYGKGLGELAVNSALNGNWVSKGATIVWEETDEIFPPKGLYLVKSRLIGKIVLNFLKRNE